MELAEGSVMSLIVSPADSNEPPCKTVAERVTADPTNSAPRMCVVRLPGLGDADDKAAISDARSLSRFVARTLSRGGLERPITVC